MGKLFRDLLSSKKFVAAIAATIAAGMMKIGWEIETASILSVISPIIAYILGQGLADLGKGANGG